MLIKEADDQVKVRALVVSNHIRDCPNSLRILTESSQEQEKVLVLPRSPILNTN
jgi:hypothetical protein